MFGHIQESILATSIKFPRPCLSTALVSFEQRS